MIPRAVIARGERGRFVGWLKALGVPFARAGRWCGAHAAPIVIIAACELFIVPIWIMTIEPRGDAVVLCQDAFLRLQSSFIHSVVRRHVSGIVDDIRMDVERYGAEAVTCALQELAQEQRR